MTGHSVREAVVSATVARDRVVVSARRTVSAGVVEFEFARPDGDRLPDWAPGAHIDVVLPDGAVRQYSLCGDRRDAFRYRIAVQREALGRGGSVTLHDDVDVGDVLAFGGPRNNFRLAPASRYLFVAAGIGITPIMPMIHQAEQLNVEWRLLYLGRSRQRLAFLDELAAYGERVTVHCADALGRAELSTWRPVDPRTRVYACGPERLLDAIQQWGAHPDGFPPKVERFTASDQTDVPSAPFEVRAARSGVSTVVGTHETIVAALRRAGVDVLTSCGQGVCGTCETDVLTGRPDHRDSLLDDAERRTSDCMFPCVSRSRDSLLILDV